MIIPHRSATRFYRRLFIGAWGLALGSLPLTAQISPSETEDVSGTRFTREDLNCSLIIPTGWRERRVEGLAGVLGAHQFIHPDQTVVQLTVVMLPMRIELEEMCGIITSLMQQQGAIPQGTPQEAQLGRVPARRIRFHAAGPILFGENVSVATVHDQKIYILEMGFAPRARIEAHRSDFERMGASFRFLEPGAAANSLPPMEADMTGMMSDDPVARAHFETANQMLAQGQMVEARAELEQALEADGEFGLAQALLAYLSLQDEDWEQARAHAQEALLLNGTNTLALTVMAWLHCYNNQLDEALRLARQALSSWDEPLARAVLVVVALVRGDFAAAETEIADLESHHPGEPQTSYLQAMRAYLQGQTEVALQSLRDYYERSQSSPEDDEEAPAERVLPGFDRLARGDAAGAEQVWRAAAERFPEDGTPLFCIALVCEQEKRYADALASFREGMGREKHETPLTQQFQRVVGGRLEGKLNAGGEPPSEEELALPPPSEGAPTGGPVLVVLRPAGVEGGRDLEIVAPAPQVEIVGLVSDVDGVAEVTINGQGVPLTPAAEEELRTLPEAERAGALRFTQEVVVSASQTLVRLVARDTQGQETVRELRVTPPPPEESRAANAPPLTAGERWALLVGIEDYEDPNITDLRYSVADARSLQEVLADPQRGGFQHLRFLSSRAETPAERPTRVAILDSLNNWLAQTKPEDTVLFYFAGHGITDARGRAYLVSMDARLNLLADTAVSQDRVNEILNDKNQVPARRVVVMMDSCHSGTRVGARAGAERGAVLDPLFQEAEGRVTLASCSADEQSFEDQEKGHGVFTYYLVEGLHGRADANGDSYITSEELNTYVQAAVKEWARIRGRKQTPRVVKNLTGEILLATDPERLRQAQAQQAQQVLAKLRRQLLDRVGDGADHLTTDEAFAAVKLLEQEAAGASLNDTEQQWVGLIKDLAEGRTTVRNYRLGLKGLGLGP